MELTQHIPTQLPYRSLVHVTLSLKNRQWSSAKMPFKFTHCFSDSAPGFAWRDTWSASAITGYIFLFCLKLLNPGKTFGKTCENHLCKTSTTNYLPFLQRYAGHIWLLLQNKQTKKKIVHILVLYFT